VNRITRAFFVAVLIGQPFTYAYAARAYPDYASLPRLPIDARGVDTGKREVEFILRDKTEVLHGRVWVGYLDYRKAWGENRRDALAGIVNEMQKGGWEVMLRDEPRNPPLATLKLTTKDNRDVWASVEVLDQARVLLLEPAGRD
jgi:hypothetical protein